jgi:hypothetical protein
MHAATSKVENSAQGSSCQLKLVHDSRFDEKGYHHFCTAYMALRTLSLHLLNGWVENAPIFAVKKIFTFNIYCRITVSVSANMKVS